MADITVVNLDNLTHGMTLNISNGSRTGNLISCNNERFDMTINYVDTDARFATGSVVQMSFNVSTWSQAYLRAYWRAKPVGDTGSTTGHAKWSAVLGMYADGGVSPIGEDANTAIRTNASGTVILEMTFTEECWGFDLHFGSVGGDWASANGTGSFEFQYLTNQLSPIDPYEQGGESATGGGTGNFDGTGDSIDFPGLPTLSSADTGFITLFNPTIGQLQSLANYMWSGLFDIDTFRKIFADPMNCILGLSIVPVSVPNGGTSAVKVGNISTNVFMTKASSQYVTVDCGSLNVNEYWGAYLDYDPYTKAELYLPYCGTHPLSVDDIMGKSVHVKYNIDILSGACCAMVKCGGSVLYSFIGQCSSSIPITGNDWTNVINGVISAAVAVGSMVATGGASAPLAVPSLASTAVNGMKPTVEKSGAMGGTGGMLAVQTPYLILTRPRQALPARQNAFTGYPSFVTANMGSLSGYTEIESVHLEGISATETELNEIENILKSGVIF